MSSPFIHPYFQLLSRRHAALHQSANKNTLKIVTILYIFPFSLNI